MKPLLFKYRAAARANVAEQCRALIRAGNKVKFFRSLTRHLVSGSRPKLRLSRIKKCFIQRERNRLYRPYLALILAIVPSALSFLRDAFTLL
jgi:hypothetical protein